MEILLLCLFSFLALYIPLFYFFFYRKKPTSSVQNLPPGTSGWPIVGEGLNLGWSGPEKFIYDRIKKYSSEIFQTSLIGENMAVFCGPSALKFLFTNEGKLLTTWWPVSNVKPWLFPSEGSLLELTLLHRGTFVHDVLKIESLKKVIPVIDSMAKRHLEIEWAPFSEVKVVHLLKKFTVALACKLLLSLEDDDELLDVERLANGFELISSGLFSMPINLPGTTYSRALKGGEAIRDMLIKIIRARRKELMENPDKKVQDFLSRLLLGTNENGKFFTEEGIGNMIIGLFLASYDTTSITVSFILSYLAEFPHIYDMVYKEQMEVLKGKGPNELLNWDDIQKMKFSWNVACETLRLRPPAQGFFRETTTDFNYGGFTIPKGWKTLGSVYSAHMNPKYFPDPQKFDPSRFEGSGPAPYTFVPFGGGTRMCAGKEYARLQILVLLHNIVTKFKWEKLVPNEKIVYRSGPIIPSGLPVRLHPHPKA